MIVEQDINGEYFINGDVACAEGAIAAGCSFFWGFLFGWIFVYLRNFFSAYFIFRIKRESEMLVMKDFLDHF